MELEEVMDYYEYLSHGPFKAGTYDLVGNNCIHFADALSIKLCGHELSEYKNLIELKVLRVMGIGFSAALAGLGLYLLISKRKRSRSHSDNEGNSERK